jgi:hypothetical protein
MKKTKTQLKIDRAVAYQQICSMTVVLEHVAKGDIDKVRHFAEYWLDVYQQRLNEIEQLEKQMETM